jgi:hypothetical protein
VKVFGFVMGVVFAAVAAWLILAWLSMANARSECSNQIVSLLGAQECSRVATASTYFVAGTIICIVMSWINFRLSSKSKGGEELCEESQCCLLSYPSRQ